MADWKLAEPRDDASRGKWWEIFEDPELNALEEQVDVSNQNIAQAEAQFRGARAAVRGARGPSFFPTVSRERVGDAVRRERHRATGRQSHDDRLFAARRPRPTELDVWGRVRRSVEASVADGRRPPPRTWRRCG